MTKNELLIARQAAGDAYRDACKTYIAAWERLHSLDLTCLNASVGLSHMIVGGFAGLPEIVPHAEFLRDEAEIRGGANGRAHAAHVQMLTTITD